MDTNRALGEEKISKLLFKFGMPCVMSLLISALYSIVDQIFIGNSSLGYIGNAATGVSFPVICIANAFAWCIGDGAAAYLSICTGRQDTEHAHKFVGTGISTTIIISVILTVICLIFMEPLMIFFGASDVTLQPAVDYFRIVALFFPFYLMINVLNGIIRVDGSPAYAMVAVVAGAIINIILDPIFIFVLDWSIRGAAIATVIGQTVSFLLCAIYFRKTKTFKLTKASFRIDKSMIKALVQLGGSTFITQISVVVLTVVSNITLFRYGMLSPYGSDIPISVFSIQTKVYTIIVNIIVGIALGSQPILGYNYGAQKMGRVRECYRLTLIASLIVGAAATVVFEFFPEIIINIFGGGSELYRDFALKSLRIYLSLSIITGVIKMSSIFFQSIGKSMEAMIASLIRDLVCLVSFTLILCSVFEKMSPGTGIYGTLVAAPLSDIIAGIVILVLTIRFFKNLDKEITVKSEENEEVPVIAPSKPGVILTIARQHGTGGKQIGKIVAEKLGIPFYYKEMTALAAKESGLANEFISDLSNTSPAVFHQLYLSTNVVQQAAAAQEKIIKKIADEGSCVIVGRAADYVLRDNENVISVYLHADKEFRIKSIMEMYEDTLEEAKVNLVKSDKARASYYESISGTPWKNADNYDLCIDASIGREKTADMIINFIEKKNK